MRVLVVAFVLLVALPTAPARADEASVYQQKATAAFALGEYKEAAEDFERAFKLHPDPALLYNAAQAHRLGGNKGRALTLYENYLRVYGQKNSRAEEVQKHIDDLKVAIEHDKAVATSPPAAPASVKAEAAKPAPSAPAPAPPAPRPAPTAPPPVTTAPSPAPTAPMLVAQPAAQASDDRSLTQKPWFWITVGGGVVAAVVVAVLISSGGSMKDPSPSLGIVNGYPP